jgi:acetoin utilization protein AcuB
MEYIDHAYRLGTPSLLTIAEEVMTANPISINERRTVEEAIAFLTDRNFRGAPVINDAGRPVGFVSQSDLLASLTEAGGDSDGSRERKVSEVMSSPVITVPRGATLERVIQLMTSRGVNRVFVTDNGGTLVGVISTLDVLRGLF